MASRPHTSPPKRRFGHRGQALVEMALVLPLFLLLVMGAIEFAMLGFHKLSLTQSARAGVRAAALGRPTGFIRSQVRSAAGGLQVTDAQVVLEYNAVLDGTGAWLPLADTSAATANTAPFGHLVRVRIVEWPHPLVTGPLLSWLPGARGNTLFLKTAMAMRRE